MVRVGASKSSECAVNLGDSCCHGSASEITHGRQARPVLAPATPAWIHVVNNSKSVLGIHCMQMPSKQAESALTINHHVLLQHACSASASQAAASN